MQRQLRAPARRRQKPNLRVPVRSVSAKVKCCTAVLGGSLVLEVWGELPQDGGIFLQGGRVGCFEEPVEQGRGIPFGCGSHGP